MRFIGELQNDYLARRLSDHLKHVGIDNQYEVAFDPATGHTSYSIWIHEEDKIDRAKSVYDEFVKNPSNPKFHAPVVNGGEETQKQEQKTFKTYITFFFLFLCATIFLINAVEEQPTQKGAKEEEIQLTPIQALLMFDVPPAFNQKESPYWHGIYDWVVHKLKNQDTSNLTGSMFYRIRQGEIWRLFTPCVLHIALLHILFNMLWLWYLGRPVEQRIGPFRTLLFTLIAGIGSNILQYLMTGPFFIGYSGIVTALAGFTWMRERMAPWEGYPLNKPTVLFLLFFIAAIFVIQVVAFFIEIFSTHSFTPNIANTAHITGALIGAFLGRFSYFAQRVPK